jgi:hypothetical protein
MSQDDREQARPPEGDPAADDDRGIVQREAEAAEAEAAEIGGNVDVDVEDPAMRPVVEGGEGEAEGFELAEKDLEESAAHGDSSGFPDEDLRDPEERESVERAEPDEAIPADE